MKKKHMKIFESYEIPSENIKNSEINLSHPISFAELREILIQISTILEERTEENVYVVSLSSGKSNSNYALLWSELDETKLYISGCSKEGIINQKTYEKAVAKLESKLYLAFTPLYLSSSTTNSITSPGETTSGHFIDKAKVVFIIIKKQLIKNIIFLIFFTSE